MDQQKLKELPAKLIPERGHQDGLVMFLALGSRYDPLNPNTMEPLSHAWQSKRLFVFAGHRRTFPRVEPLVLCRGGDRKGLGSWKIFGHLSVT